MKRRILTLILVSSTLLVAWAFANPPSGTPGTTRGALFGDSAGNIGIATTTPATALDVNGIMTIRKSLTMMNNRIINLLAPTANTDAVNKAYADAQIANMASSTTKLWGEGRPGTGVVATAGECATTINNTQIKVSRSNTTATWDGARAACPANWWVCSAAERGSSTCGTTTKPIIFCDPVPVDEELYAINGNWAWISDAATVNDRKAKAISTASGSNTVEQYACSRAPVWCCSY